MRFMKKISAVLLSLCLLVPCFAISVQAAHGRISFTDPKTAVGEMVEVKCVVKSTSGSMGEVEVELGYDSDFLKFKSGNGVTDSNGTLTCKGNGGSAEASFVIKFQAVQEGSTKISVKGTTIKDTNGAVLDMEHGGSAITIAAGDPSKIESDEAPESKAGDTEIEVNGVVYTLTDNFANADIPTGYSRTTRELDGEERQMIENEAGTICLAYMMDESNVGDFFLYMEETATFAPYEELTISDSTTIVVLSDTSLVNLPDTYQQATLTLNDKEFPVWQDTLNDGFYVMYAMSSNGETGYYRYDSAEGTYQRFDAEAATATGEEETEVDTSTILGKIEKIVGDHLSLAIIAGLALAGLGLIILLILAIKLHNRNAEIDELYDEYGIDLEEEEPAPAPKKKESKKKNRRQKYEEEDFEEDFEEEDFEEEDFEEEDFEEEDFEEEDFEEEDFEEDFEEDYFGRSFKEEEDFAKTRYVGAAKPAKAVKPEEDVFAGYETRSELTIDDLDDLLGEKKTTRRGHFDVDDTFQMDFIDLD